MPYSTSQKRKDALRRFYAKRRRNGLCVRCGKPVAEFHKHCVECLNRLTQEHRARAADLRAQVIRGYGGQCACCGEAINEFLAIDHKEIRACDEARKAGRPRTTIELCLIILRDNFPTTYQILCHNCNQSFGSYGYCPHHPEILRTTRKSLKPSLPSIEYWGTISEALGTIKIS